MVGMPLISIMLYFATDETATVLSKKVNECKKGEEIQKHIRYFLHYADHRGIDRNVDIILKGYIYNHEENCVDNDCPLKEYKKYLDKGHLVEKYGSIHSSSHHRNSKEHNHHSLEISPKQYLYEFANRVFQKGLAKYPNSTSLRISYALFLWDRFKNKNQSLQEFSIAAKYNPPFDEQFIIFRYKKIINEEEESKHQSEEALDVVSGIAYESHYKQCHSNILKAANLYMDFWDQLTNQNTPDLSKLNDLGKKINTTNTSIEIHWRSMQAIKSNDPKAVKLYAGYIMDVLNNREKGMEMLQLWRNSR